MPKEHNNSSSDGDDPFRPLISQFARIVKGHLVKRANGLVQDDANNEDVFGPLVDNFEHLLRSTVIPNFKALMEDEEYEPYDDDRLLISPIKPPKRVLTSLAVGADDAETTYVMLLTQPGFEAWQSQLRQLQQSVELWRDQKLSKGQIYSNLHVAIFSEDEEVAVDFAKHYHAFLRASEVLPIDGRLHRIDGTSTSAAAAVDQMYGGMYFISEADKLSFHHCKSMASAMQFNDTIIVASYVNTKKEQLPAVLKGLFPYQFDLNRAGVTVAVKAVIKMLQAWSKEQYDGRLEFEGGIDGQYVEIFARRVARKKTHKRSLKTCFQEELGRIQGRQTMRLLQEREAGSSPYEFWISQSDLLGVAPDISTFQSKPWQDLQAMVGLEEVKASLESFLNGLLVDFHRELKGERPLRSGLSRLFIGPPGTGNLLRRDFTGPK